MPTIHTNFDPSKVPLQGSNLIEASAGTGKTFSIALMAVRLLLEKEMPLDQILMVTFTKAAVSELELRVRSFIRKALRQARKSSTEGDPLSMLIRDYCDTEDKRERAVAVLQQAQLDMDRLQIMTIHGFCQQAMRQYSLETGQVFGAETLGTDESDKIAEEAFHAFWRSRVNVLDKEILGVLLAAGLSRHDAFSVVRQALSGKLPYRIEEVPDDFLSLPHQRRILKFIREARVASETIRSEVIHVFQSQWDTYLAWLSQKPNRFASNAYRTCIEQKDAEGLYDALYKTCSNNYAANFFNSLQKRVLQAREQDDSLTEFARKFNHLIAVAAFEHVAEEVDKTKSDRGVITFDDMISKLAVALEREQDRAASHVPGETLQSQLSSKYDAVFIDEFQDTDRDQFYIFDRLFKNDKILFYIGDPKQSIYGWRKADIYTYFKASSSVDHIHQMNVNRRSNAALIQAMNLFFLPDPATDSFAYHDAAEAIHYIPVESPDPNAKAILYYAGSAVPPLRISPFQNKRQLLKGLLHIAASLLRDEHYLLFENGKQRRVKPSDIGVLVRSNKEASEIKDLLAKNRIAAVTIDDTKIFSSQEARDLYYIMLAVYDINRANINRALMTDIGGYDRDKLLSADQEAVFLRFRMYQEAWKEEGVYVMFRRFLADHSIEDVIADDAVANPERTISNILQLIELIHKVSEEKRFDIREQIQWLKKGIDGEMREGDEYLQRVESDEDAIKIVTIHKSKGLEYKIVLAPDLDFIPSKKHKTISYRDPEDSKYYVIDKVLKTGYQEELYLRQQEQENRRLLYVAVTRAQAACFIQANDYHKGSTLRVFRDLAASHETACACFDPAWLIDTHAVLPKHRESRNEANVSRAYAQADGFDRKLIARNWRRSSYSGLNPEHPSMPLKYTDSILSEFDHFVFRELRKGAHTGNLLHYIFERIDFSRPDGWDAIIERAVKRLFVRPSADLQSKIKKFLLEVMHTVILPESSLSLYAIQPEERMSELEFDFPLTDFFTDSVGAINNDPSISFRLRKGESLEGIMNGKIDLIFRHQGKFYILDWKSNYLGDRIEDYSLEKIKSAMNDNNYHLQYHIYTVALVKYLKSRLPEFDYDLHVGGCIYLFVRGIRKGAETGIYFHKPAREVIDRLMLSMDRSDSPAEKNLISR